MLSKNVEPSSCRNIETSNHRYTKVTAGMDNKAPFLLKELVLSTEPKLCGYSLSIVPSSYERSIQRSIHERGGNNKQTIKANFGFLYCLPDMCIQGSRRGEEGMTVANTHFPL